MKVRCGWKGLTVFIVLPAFLLQGCGYWMKDRGTVYADRPYEVIDGGVQRATVPYETSEPKLIKTEKGQETTQESFIPEHWEVIDDGSIPGGSFPRPIFDADPVWRVDKSRLNTFKAVEEYAKKMGYAILLNAVEFPAIMTSATRRTIQTAKTYMIPPGKYTVFKPDYQANGDIILTPIEVPSCRNQLVKAYKIKWVPRTKTITKVRVDKEVWSAGTERYLDTRAVTERYRDVNTQIDAGAVALGALGGLAVGVGLGYLFWFGGATASSSVVVNPACPAGVCAPGFPAPRPLP